MSTPPGFAELVLRARGHEAKGDLVAAIADLDAALRIDATNARAWNELGLLCADAGMADRAVDAFTRATHADATYARAWNNLGNALQSARRTADAIGAVERAVAADDRYVLAWVNLGALRRQAGDDAGAEAALRRALALDPANHAATMALGGLLHERSDLVAAAALFASAAQGAPGDAVACHELAHVLAERDDLAGARAAFAEAERRDPSMLRATLGRRLTLPMIAEDARAVAEVRDAFDRGLAALERELPPRAANMPFERRVDELRRTNFLLAYQGEDDRVLQARYGALVAGLLATPARDASSGGGRVKVGFASAFFSDSTAGRYFERWVTGLPRDRFDVHVYHLRPGLDALGERIAARADRMRHCPRWRPSQIAPVIRDDALDVLVYPEVGMAPVAFALAALRLAPLQCAGWGHPVTTGLPTIDAFLSSACMEPEGGTGHYTEELVPLPGIGTSYAMPQLPPAVARGALGLPEGVPLLLCPQSLFKIHPDNDALFARVLDAAPRAVLVGFEGRDAALTAKFLARLGRAGVAPGRVRLLPQCAHGDYLRVNLACDVMLDTLRWSGGNTSLDAIACGLPIVTLPGAFMRGRQSAGMLGLQGLGELVATDEDDYVRKVAALAADDGWRRATSQRIVAARDRVFDDAAPVAALADFLAERVGR
jgi:CRISPR-associated protein Csy1